VTGAAYHTNTGKESDRTVDTAGDETGTGSNGTGMTKATTGGRDHAVGPRLLLDGVAVAVAPVTVHHGQHLWKKSVKKESTYDFVITTSFSHFYRISPKDTPQEQKSNEVGDKPLIASLESENFELEMPVSPPPLEDVLAARRARRAEILAKYANAAPSPSPTPVQGTQAVAASTHEGAASTPGDIGTFFLHPVNHCD